MNTPNWMKQRKCYISGISVPLPAGVIPKTVVLPSSCPWPGVLSKAIILNQTPQL